ncbi:hypothetical protein PZA11_004552 [Diplocarpon coronariae]
MGRRKIEIKAIKDDRNRSVTFLKRKGGLFKKAHELSVLCSVDVAVVIFGNNKKLYEYSSSDIGEIMTRYQYYGVANEHKGPADFDGKGKLDDDDDDDDGSLPSHHGSVEPQMLPPQFQNQANFQHIRHHTPSASPPIANIIFPHHAQPRQHTPQPQSGSRPSSRNALHRTSSNLVPPPPPQQPPPPPHAMAPNGYAYMPSPAMYNAPNGSALPQHMQQGPPRSVGLPQHGSPYASYGPSPPQPPQPPQTPPHPYPQQVQQLYAEEQRRSMTPIFTPIDESRSILSQHWASSTSNVEPSRAEFPPHLGGLAQSLDVAAGTRIKHDPSPPPPLLHDPSHDPSHHPSLSLTSGPEDFPPPSRSSSGPLGAGKRPVLKVQIPDEPSEGDSSASPRSGNAAGPNGPPTGPPTADANPGVFLPSPSSFYSDWPNYGGASATLPSPLNFATPVVGTGPSFLRDDGGGLGNGKRKSPEADGGDGDAKRLRMDS